MILTCVLLVFAAFLGLAMELYKKTIRHDNAAEMEIKIVALGCSALLAYVAYRVAPEATPAGDLNRSRSTCCSFPPAWRFGNHS
jgi:hypothetical protein